MRLSHRHWIERTLQMRILLPVLVGTASLTAPTSATTQLFSGTIENRTPPGAPGGRCGPAPTLTLSFAPETTRGTSNLGNFAVSASHCVIPTPPVTNYGSGLSTFAFDTGDTLTGTYTGTFSLVQAGAESLQNYVVTGGTGRFSRTVGTFQHKGSIRFGQGGVTTGLSTFEGRLSMVPEPATWGMLILGFAVVGGAMRRRQRGSLVPA
jgi:PEP-CTERM motif